MKKLLLILLCVILVSCSGNVGGGSNDDRVVLKIDGHDVTYDEYRYFFMNMKNELDGGDTSYWTSDNERILRDTVMETIIRHYSVYNLAEQYKIKFDNDMKTAVDDEIKYTIDSYGGDDGYYMALEENYMTGDCYRNILEISQLEIAVRDYLIDEFTSDIMADDATVEKDFNANFARATHILIQHNNDTEYEQNKELAEELSNRISNGEDFDELLISHGQDIGIDYENGYYLTHGMYNETFENTVYSLNIDEISEVIESAVGFHIIKRLPLDINYLYDNYEEIRYIYKNRIINERLDKIAETLKVDYEDLYNEINISTMK